MKNLSRLLFTMLLVLSFSNVKAQDEDNPWAVNFGVNAVDVFPVGEDLPQGDFADEFFNVDDHWNILPSLSTVAVSRYLGHGLTGQLGGSLNQIDKWGESADNDSNRVNDLAYYAIDANVRYNLTKTKLQPVIGLGGGYSWIEEGPFNTFSVANGASNTVGYGTVNGSLGLNYWFTHNIGLFLESKFKNSFDSESVVSHFQHSAGVSVKFGGKDTDGDGIYDKDDACPEVAGLEEFNGCPDSDGDGITDAKDDCPNTAGLAEMNGCPDSDGDGVTDAKDDCPTVKGLKAMSGCPDADGDGITDAKDKCPKEPGPKSNDGCPDPDTDGDGVKDKVDKCPKVKGTVANNGCPEAAPEPTQEVIEKLNSYARIILFDTGKSSFQNQTYEVLKNITAILKEYPESKFSIEGHTDSVGSKSSNQALSEKRANAVKDYLVTNGIGSDRLVAYGFGEEYPIDSNTTKAGRANNRRTEVKLRK